MLLHGGWEAAQQFEREGHLRDFSQAPIKKWFDEHYAKPRRNLGNFASRRRKVDAR
jgi:hypothetical protein